jgi:hypothetical protein
MKFTQRFLLQSCTSPYLSDDASSSASSLLSVESCSASSQWSMPSLVFSPPSPYCDSDDDNTESEGIRTPVEDEADGALAPPSTPRCAEVRNDAPIRTPADLSISRHGTTTWTWTSHSRARPSSTA